MQNAPLYFQNHSQGRLHLTACHRWFWFVNNSYILCSFQNYSHFLVDTSNSGLTLRSSNMVVIFLAVLSFLPLWLRLRGERTTVRMGLLLLSCLLPKPSPPIPLFPLLLLTMAKILGYKGREKSLRLCNAGGYAVNRVWRPSSQERHPASTAMTNGSCPVLPCGILADSG